MKWKLYFARGNQQNQLISPIPRIDRNQSLPNVFEDWVQDIDDYIRNCSEKLQNVQLSSALSPVDKLIIRTMKSLRDRDDIVITPADKNLGTVIMSTEKYNTMCYDHLYDQTTYCKLSHEESLTCNNNAYAALERILSAHDSLFGLKRNNEGLPVTLSPLAKSLCQLKGSKYLRIGNFYALPKVHKPVVAGRPIVGSIDTVTYHTSKYLHNILFPLVGKLTSVCTSSRAAIYDLQYLSLTSYDDQLVIVCADVKSLYPSIPIDYGLQAVKYVLESFTHQTDVDVPLIMDLLKWTLENNFLEFNGETYRQISGTAMGTPVAVCYANIVLYHLEQPCLDLSPVLYRRFIDDLFIICRSPEQGHDIVTMFNSRCDAIQLDAVTISRSGVFLDLHISLNEDNSIKLSLFQKEMNKHLYIPPASNHSRGMLKNIISQEIKRYRLNCSDDQDFKKACQSFRTRLQRRGYKIEFLAELFHNLPQRSQLLEDLNKQFAKKRSKTMDQSRRGPIITVCLPNKPQCSLKSILSIPQQLRSHPLYLKAYGDNDIILGKKNMRSIGAYITFKPRPPCVITDIPSASAEG
jgi:hypothetical protein